MTALLPLVGAELAEPVPDAVRVLAARIAAKHGAAARAVLFYGSCLREQRFDGLMLDFYLIVSDYRVAYDRRWLGWANAALPPNVFPFEYNGMVAKYAVLSESDFARQCSARAATVSVWARFAQPSRLVWAADNAAADQVAQVISGSFSVLYAAARPMVDFDNHSADDPATVRFAVTRTAFALTYAAELRAERAHRPDSVVDADPDRYLAFAAAAIAEDPALSAPVTPAERRAARARWRRYRRNGKLLSLLRLAKASLTFAGGIDYLAWKINRHAGTAIVIRPWQRRFPLVAALILLPRLLVRGAVK